MSYKPVNQRKGHQQGRRGGNYTDRNEIYTTTNSCNCKTHNTTSNGREQQATSNKEKKKDIEQYITKRKMESISQIREYLCSPPLISLSLPSSQIKPLLGPIVRTEIRLGINGNLDARVRGWGINRKHTLLIIHDNCTLIIILASNPITFLSLERNSVGSSGLLLLDGKDGVGGDAAVVSVCGDDVGCSA